MKTNLSCKTVVPIIVCLTFFTAHSNAQTHTWTNTLGGIFADNGNWDIGAPGPTSTARFDKVGTYGVAFNADAQIESVFLVSGEVAFVGGKLLKLTGSGSFRGGTTRFLDSGTELQANTISVGGQNNPPLFQVESRATVFTQSDFGIAEAASWSGTATITGVGSQLDVGSTLKVGAVGTGTLNIEDRGEVLAALTSIGSSSGAIGEVTVSDEESALNTDELFVGVHPTGGSPGKGTLNLQSGGDVNVGDNQPATNTGSNLYVSNTATAAKMHVGNGSLIANDGGAYIGYDNGAFGEVTLDNADWTNGGKIRVGYVGDGILNLENGSDVVAESVWVSTNVPATGVLNVDGAGTVILANQIAAGLRGNGTINVTNGGIINTVGGIGTIAALEGIGTANVNGIGSRWLTSKLYLGRSAAVNPGGVGTLNVENGGAVFVGNNVSSIIDALVISDGGTDGNLAAANGSQINCNDAFLGYGVNNSGVVELEGNGTQWNIAGDLMVGRLGNGSLNITNGASVDAQETFVNDMSEIIMDGGQLDVGSNLSNEGLLHFTGGTNQVAGPVSNLAGGDITVDSGATVDFLGKVGHTGNPIVVDGEIFFMGAYLGENAITGIGDVNFNSILRPFNLATGQIFFAGGGNVFMDSGAQTEIDIAGSGDFDSMTVSGGLKINGSITINWLGGFQPSLGQEYLIASVIGNSTGQFTGLGESDMVTQVGTVGLFISYTAGDGNDVALFTALVPEIVVPADFTVTRGTYVSGGLAELADSDDSDISIRRRNSDLQSRTELEVASFATSANPSYMEVTVEGSVFARSTVVQTIQVFNFDTQLFEVVDTRNAARFNDNSTTVVLMGNLSRYVDDGSNKVVARVLYQSANNRQRFASNTDLFTWGFAD